MSSFQQSGLSLPTKESPSTDQSQSESEEAPIQTEKKPSSRLRSHLSRYVQKVKYKGEVSYRYLPPADAVEAGVVKRVALGKSRAKANAYADEHNILIDKWRWERSYLKNLTNKARVRDLVKAYENSLSFKKLNEKSAEAYLYYLSVWVDKLVGGVPLLKAKLKDISTPMCQRVYDDSAGKSISLANHSLAVWRVIFNFAIRHGYTQHNPFSKVQRMAVRQRKVVWTKEELSRFLDVAYSDFRTRNIGLIVQMAYEWGQRLGDMRTLRWDNFDFETGVLSLEQSKRRARISLPTSDGLRAMLKQQHEEYGWQKYIAPSSKSDRKGGLLPITPNNLARVGDTIKKKANIPDEVKLMDLRRTAVTEMIEAEVPLPNIMAMTGHATPQSVAPYLKHTLKGAIVAAKARGFI